MTQCYADRARLALRMNAPDQPKADPLGLAADRGAQLATLKAGWRFYKRAVERRANAEQALAEWIDAVEAVLDLGAEPRDLQRFAAALTEVRDVEADEELRRRIRTLAATLQ